MTPNDTKMNESQDKMSAAFTNLDSKKNKSIIPLIARIIAFGLLLFYGLGPRNNAFLYLSILFFGISFLYRYFAFRKKSDKNEVVFEKKKRN
jgi:4-hydroxybenzoate polyprenyltransferase